ncbi:MAG: UDP-N-acetylmuramoyl-L-alanyl-D-glutamate--2,6-diaminopimelate ligase, partial [Planctomycetota bacterium]
MTLVRSIGGAIGNPGQVPAGLVLTGVQLDSRRVQPGDLFVALAGSQRDGWSFVPQAIERGAAAILASDLPAGMALPIPVWLHPDPRRALGLAAATFAGNPSRDLEVVAITGTNGKTTTAFLLRSLLRAQGQDPALLGTTGYYLARGVFEPATHTTPDAITLQHLFARQREVDGGTVIMEASSHALDQERLAGTSVDLAVFTNLSRDHLDYHGDMESYAASKARLFACLDRHGAAVLNADDHEYPRMVHAARAAGARVLSTSLQSPADLWANHLRTDTSGTRFDLHGLGFSATGIHVPLLGAHNISNLLQALACARWLGHDTAGLLAALPHLQAAPGRLEPIPLGPGRPAAWVDYAHTPDALQNVLTSLRRIEGGGKLWVLFGCGGERDQGKRAQMGEVAARLADEVWITSDNPRSEEPAAIANAIWQGVCAVRGTSPEACRIELDRREAIHSILQAAGPGDRVLIAGKGHESVQEIGGQKLPFDDRAVAQEV